MCCYTGPVTDAARNEDAARFTTSRDKYGLKQDAKTFRFQPGDIWRQACAGDGDDVLPFIHRAPKMEAGDPPRLLLVG